MGIATVSVAAIGVTPMASSQQWISLLFHLVGGTPTSARETRAIPLAELRPSVSPSLTLYVAARP
jgi:hypothetical protein